MLAMSILPDVRCQPPHLGPAMLAAATSPLRLLEHPAEGSIVSHDRDCLVISGFQGRSDKP